MIGLRVAEGIRQCDLIQSIAELERPSVGAPFIAKAGVWRSMLPSFSPFQLAEDLLQSTLPDRLLGFAGDLKGAFLVFFREVPLIFQILYKITYAIAGIGQSIAAVQIGQPAQRLRHIPAGHGDQLKEDVQQVVKSIFRGILLRGKLSKPKSFHLFPFLGYATLLNGTSFVQNYP